jgi:hypothetical protein
MVGVHSNLKALEMTPGKSPLGMLLGGGQKTRNRSAGPVDPLFRAPSGCFRFTVQRHKFNDDSLSVQGGEADPSLVHPELLHPTFDLQPQNLL